jgi:hypothetical protein
MEGMMGVGGVQTRWYQGLLSPRTKKIKGRTKPSSVHEAKTAEQWAAVLVGNQNGTKRNCTLVTGAPTPAKRTRWGWGTGVGELKSGPGKI